MINKRKLAKRVLQTALSSRILRGNLARDMFFLVAKEFTPSVVSTVGSIRYHVSTADRTVGREVFLTGGYDSDCIARIFRILASVGYSDFAEKTFIDVGANIGTTSIPAIKRFKFGRVVAFEPEPTNYTLLTENVILNGFQNCISALNLAVSDRPGELLFELCPVNHGDHRVRSADTPAVPDMMHEGERDVISVKATTLDLMMAKGAIRAEETGLVWIDTEGHEGHVFQGAQAFLASDVPVVVEYWPYAMERAGGLEMFEQIATAHFSEFIDARAGTENGAENRRPISSLSSLRNHYKDQALTDLVLLKG